MEYSESRGVTCASDGQPRPSCARPRCRGEEGSRGSRRDEAPQGWGGKGVDAVVVGRQSTAAVTCKEMAGKRMKPQNEKKAAAHLKIKLS